MIGGLKDSCNLALGIYGLTGKEPTPLTASTAARPHTSNSMRHEEIKKGVPPTKYLTTKPYPLLRI